MSSKAPKVVAGGHTAGIYADMSVDGPIIGTLVAIIDRARNLPNRKTMGKQNPYCAARLGKEAKKTDTDMRGGQTPRWDQELRFTVHETPDYYQLKVSVFNDDKRTELIGETWVDLKSVVIPGGGQNDLWHALQCKGKYAGDVRIELTYYDTRPKDEAVIERRKEVEKVDTKTESAHTLSGPRQPKAPKKRPLPADPTGSSPARPSLSDYVHPPPASGREHPHSSPMRPPVPDQPEPSPNFPHAYDNAPEEFHQPRAGPPSHHSTNNSMPPHQPYADPRDDFPEIHPNDYDPHHQALIPAPRDYGYRTPPDRVHGQQSLDHGQLRDRGGDGYEYTQDPNVAYDRNPYETPPRQSAHAGATPDHRYNGQPLHPLAQRNLPHIMSDTHPQPSPPEFPQTRVTPGSGDRRNHYHRYSTSPTKSDVFRDSPLRNSMNPADYHPQYEFLQPQVQDAIDDGPPPPPPVHRDGLSQPQHLDHLNSDVRPVSVPDPLNIVSERILPNTNVGGPQNYVAYSPNYVNSGFPLNDNEPQYSASPTQSYQTYTQRERTRSQDRPGTSNASVPSALVAGYDQSMLDRETDGALYDNRLVRRQSVVPLEPTPSPKPIRSSTMPVSERPSHGTSPEPRYAVPRKQLGSPSPPHANEDTLSFVPFSPDSYDVLNPAGNLSAVQAPAPHYETPEAAMEAARQREVEKLRELGPIVGNDGRIIDPSDHLPSDTWAPEPERKSRKPEVIVRFKHGSQPKPRSNTLDRAGGQPHPLSVATPYRQHHSQPTTPQSAEPTPSLPSAGHSGRKRLQKQFGRPQSYVQPNVNEYNHISSPRSSNALRERENFAGYEPNGNSPVDNDTSLAHGNSPIHSQHRTSPSATPHHSPSSISRLYHPSVGPPIPAKVPVQPGIQNYPATYGAHGGGNGDFDALAEEMKRIDIGVGSGGRRARASFTGGYGA